MRQFATATPAEVVVGFAPGGVADIAARVVAQKLRQNHGRVTLP